eukprot:TRINITY_DN2175_c0_g1_i1.p1 TRINITY_DN2175_c0_g1~~TRINITY_DN2175_c0_g1_i1.p1  ORF type:complete len:766 (+),score=88.40 TRINITY_DN2175_c0_g1_i1:148-2445(+)
MRFYKHIRFMKKMDKKENTHGDLINASTKISTGKYTTALHNKLDATEKSIPSPTASIDDIPDKKQEQLVESPTLENRLDTKEEQRKELKPEEDMVPAKDVKGKYYITNILDKFPNAKIKLKPIYFSDTTKRAVYKGINNSNEYVLKVVHSRIKDKTTLQQLKVEFDNVCQLCRAHPNFVQGIRYEHKNIDSNSVQVKMLFEYGGNSLLSLMSKATSKEIKMWLLQSLEAYRYSHAARICNFDIKPDNLLYWNGLVKVIDLGTAIEFARRDFTGMPLREYYAAKLKGFTPLYAPPELKENFSCYEEIIGEKIDVFCWGMTFYQLIMKLSTGELMAIREKVRNKEDHEKIFVDELKNMNEIQELDFKHVIGNVISECLQYNPKDRPTFEEIKEKLQCLEKETYENEKVMVDMFNTIGEGFCRQIGNYKIALEYLKKSLDIAMEIFGEGDPATAKSYNTIGLVYFHMKEDKIALEYYKKSLDISIKIFREGNPDIAISYNRIGLIYDNMGDYKAALEYFKKSLDIAIKIFGEEDPFATKVYNNIGLVHCSMKDYKTALEYLKKSLHIRTKIVGEEHPDIANFYSNIGMVYSNMEDDKTALEYLKESLKIRIKILGEEHPDTEISYSGIGAFYYNMGDDKTALEYYKKSLDIILKVFGKEHSNTARSYNSIGMTHYNMKDYKTALEYLKKSLDIRMKIFDEEHPDIATLYEDIGLVYYNMGDYKTAIESYGKAWGSKCKDLMKKSYYKFSTRNLKKQHRQQVFWITFNH